MAARLATRALAWGTLVTALGAAAGVIAVRFSGVRTVDQFGTRAADVLDPVEAWLQGRGQWMRSQMGRLHSLGTWAGEALDGPRKWLAFRVSPKPGADAEARVGAPLAPADAPADDSVAHGSSGSAPRSAPTAAPVTSRGERTR